MANLYKILKYVLYKPLNIAVLARTDLQHTAQRFASQGGTTTAASKPAPAAAKPAPAAAKPVTDVPGLSSAVYKLPSGEVGPGASKDGSYKNPEYFCYNRISYFEAEIEMLKYRLPQPSSLKK
ncbi:uncharacterized protein [Periplaneta americana]|uniref:uncharacterized protein n=1 Tax=Periplaneta americana TaxID=6978 RepID=UPI0037E721DB